MQRRTFFGGALSALTLGACASTQDAGEWSPVADLPFCQKQRIHYDPATRFHLDVLVVEDGARAFQYEADAPGSAGQEDYKKVGRYFGPMEATFYLNLAPRVLGRDTLPFLVGNGICEGMAPVLPAPELPGYSIVVVSVAGGRRVNGQISLVLPPKPLLNMKDRRGNHLSFQPVVSLDIPTVGNAKIHDTRFNWPSTQIARMVSPTSSMTRVEQRLRNGDGAALFYFVHGV